MVLAANPVKTAVIGSDAFPIPEPFSFAGTNLAFWDRSIRA